MQKKECRLSRGKALGGTSTIGNLHYRRANRRDFLGWEEVTDNTWSPATAITHYKAIEGLQNLNEFTRGYGLNGEITLNTRPTLDYVRQPIFKSAKYMGYQRMKMDDNFGYVETLLTIDSGVRQNSAKAFLTPIKDRNNLKLILQAEVKRVSFTNSKAQTVEVSYKNNKYNVKALKEIILTAGTINTAKILLASGVGPKEQLKELKIPLIADKNVGANLQDHFSVPILVSINIGGDKAKAPERAFEYLMHKGGWLSKINIHDIVGYINTFETPFDSPNMAIYHYFFEKNDDLLEDYFKNLGYIDKTLKSIVRHNKENAIIAFFPTLLKPKSKGRVFLKNNEIVIDGNYLDDDLGEDLETLTSGVRYIMKFIESADLVRLEAKLLQIDVSNCRTAKLWSQPYIKCLIKNLGFPGSQMVGTAKMTSCCDEGVVGADLIVKGLRGLRVVDGSVIPEPVSANLQATLAMMGNRAAELIKGKWKRR